MTKQNPSSSDRQTFGISAQTMSFEENDDFNEDLDQQYGSFEIAGLSFRASQVLYTMDPEGYRSAFQDFQQRQIEEFKEIVYEQFPTPIAYAFFRAEVGSENDVQRLHFLRDVWESLIYTLYALIIGEYRYLHLPLENIPLANKRLEMKHILSDKLGDKLSIIHALREKAVSHGYNLNCLGLIKIDVIESLRTLNRVRNDISHSGAISEEQARRLYTQHYDKVLSILRQSEDLSNAVLLRFTSHGNHALECRFEEFVGHAMTRRYKKINFTSDQYAMCVDCLHSESIALWYKDHIYSVSPFLHFVSRDQGHQTRLCFYKTRRRQDFLYEVVGETQPQTFPEARFSNEVKDYQTLLLPNISRNLSS